jgi:uncharacterized protein YbaP (TraB family)
MKTGVLFVSLLASFFANSQLLYEIKSKDGQHTSYLFGTIHMMPKEHFNIDSTLTAAFNKSSMIAMEVDLNMDLAQKIELAKETILPEGKTLRDICTDAQYQLIYTYALDSMHMSKKKFKRYSRLKPFFFSSVMLQESLEDTKSYELEFGEMAKTYEGNKLNSDGQNVKCAQQLPDSPMNPKYNTMKAITTNSSLATPQMIQSDILIYSQVILSYEEGKIETKMNEESNSNNPEWINEVGQ